MKWFKHDADASSDAKIKKLIIRHGAIGYAVYFHCLELIAGKVSNDNITFELEHDSEIIADNLRIQGTGDKSGMDVVEGIMRTIIGLNLFEERGGSITCPKMLKRLDSSMTNNKQFRELIKDARNSHDNLIESHDSLTKNHDPVMTSHDSVSKSADDVMIEKNRIEKKRREENIYSRFFSQWNSLELQKHTEKVVKSHWQKKHTDEIALYGEEVVLKAMENYATVLKSEDYYFNYSWTLWDFIIRGLSKFVDNAEPLVNYKKDLIGKKVGKEDYPLDMSGYEVI